MDLPPNTKSIDYKKKVQQREEGECKKHKPNPNEDGKRCIINDLQHPELKIKESEDWKRGFVDKHAKLNPFRKATQESRCALIGTLKEIVSRTASTLLVSQTQ